MNPASAAAVVLSAGLSRRMGDFKPLLPLGGMTLLERVIRLFRTAGIARIHVVVGHRAAELIPRISRWGAAGVVNPRYAEDMFTSVTAGVADLDPATRCFFLLPVDIALVRPATLRDLLEAFPASADAVCHPVFGGRRGHPPLIGARHIPAILNWHGRGGLAALLERLEQHAVEVAVVDEFIHQDMDRPADYRRMAERLYQREVFSAAECEALLTERLQAAPRVAAHGRAVAGVATAIARALNGAGFALDLDLIDAAARVHDLARGRPEHARQGANMLRELDMPRMADIVAGHMDMAVDENKPIGEAEVVFLADKLVEEDRYVGLEKRFERRMHQFAPGSEAETAARRKRRAARLAAARIETAIGRGLDDLLRAERI